MSSAQTYPTLDSWNVEKYFFFGVIFLMASGGCGLAELLCALMYEFNVELSIVVPFPTPSEALWVVTYMKKYFFSMFYFSWPRLVVFDRPAMYTFVYFQNQGAMWGCLISSTFRGVGTWKSTIIFCPSIAAFLCACAGLVKVSIVWMECIL